MENSVERIDPGSTSALPPATAKTERRLYPEELQRPCLRQYPTVTKEFKR